jgi:flagellar motor switch protein FliM
MSEVLSQTEIDNLISAIASGQEELPLQAKGELQAAAKNYNSANPIIYERSAPHLIHD